MCLLAGNCIPDNETSILWSWYYSCPFSIWPVQWVDLNPTETTSTIRASSHEQQEEQFVFLHIHIVKQNPSTVGTVFLSSTTMSTQRRNNNNNNNKHKNDLFHTNTLPPAAAMNMVSKLVHEQWFVCFKPIFLVEKKNQNAGWWMMGEEGLFIPIRRRSSKTKGAPRTLPVCPWRVLQHLKALTLNFTAVRPRLSAYVATVVVHPPTTTAIPNKILTSASTHCKNSQIFTKLQILLSQEQALKSSKSSALSPSCTRRRSRRRRRRRRRITVSLHKEKNDEQSSLTKTHWKLWARRSCES